MILIGIDLSLTSPGIAVLNEHKKWQCYAFHQHKKKNKDFQHPNITLLPSIPGTEVCDAIRFRHIVDHILNIVQVHQLCGQVQVVLEGYAFDANNSGHSFKLIELGGILKLELLEKCGITCVILPPTKWKKYAVGHGDASKLDVVTFMMTNGPCLDFMTLLGIKLPPDNVPPSPISDFCDSIGIVLAHQYLSQHGPTTKATKKRKLKNDPPCKKKKQSVLHDHLNLLEPRDSEAFTFDFGRLFDNC